MHEGPEHVAIPERWMRGYRPEELFDGEGRLKAELAELAPRGTRRMSANPHADGGLRLRELRLPDFRAYAVGSERPGASDAEAARGWPRRSPATTAWRATDHLVQDVVDRLPQLGARAAHALREAEQLLRRGSPARAPPAVRPLEHLSLRAPLPRPKETR